MDWPIIAKTDYEIYQDSERVKEYVRFEKINAVQYEEITGEPYEA
jgi:hypothetical protein